MNAKDLDEVYTALAQAVTRAGEARAPLLLAMLGMALLSRQDDAAQALEQIRQAEQALDG